VSYRSSAFADCEAIALKWTSWGRGIVSRKKKIMLVAFGALAAIGAAVAVVIFVIIMPHSAERPGVRSGQGALGTAQQARLERTVTSANMSVQATAVAPGIRAAFISRGVRLLPAGSHMRISPASFRITSAITAVVNATVTGPQPGHWRLLLVHQGGQWLLLGTRRLP
jgi:hypothetical protein